MALADGDPAPDGDVWYRILSSDKHIIKGRVQHAAFQGKAISATPVEKGRAWNAELSGRLRSMAGSQEEVEKHAIEHCKKANRSFYGLMYPKEVLPGQTVEGARLGLYYTPIDGGDQAHSDLTFTGPIPMVERSEEHDRFVMALSKKFHGLHPSQLDILPPANIASSQPKPVQSNEEGWFGKVLAWLSKKLRG